MSGTAPSDSNPGGPARGIKQKPLDANQHGQAQNIIDESKDTHGTQVDRNIGDSIDAGKDQGGLSDRAMNLLNDKSGGAGPQVKETSQEGFKVGGTADLHDLAQSKQP